MPRNLGSRPISCHFNFILIFLNQQVFADMAVVKQHIIFAYHKYLLFCLSKYLLLESNNIFERKATSENEETEVKQSFDVHVPLNVEKVSAPKATTMNKKEPVVEKRIIIEKHCECCKKITTYEEKGLEKEP